MENYSEYARRGFSIVTLHGIRDGKCTCGQPACPAPGKHPSTKNGTKEASGNVIKLAREQFDGCNIGIATGTALPDGGYLAVIDWDPRSGGDETLGALEEKYGQLPRTPTQISGRGDGGGHMLFRTKTPVASARLGEGLDLKGAGGYIVVAPSKHAAGGNYTWDVDRGLDTPIADLPAWVQTSAPQHRIEHLEDDPIDTFLGRVAEKMGWLGEFIGNGKRSVRCPWDYEHTDSSWHARSSGTVLLPATPGDNFGAFKCAHAHCAHRKTNEFLAAASEEARDYARSFFIPKVVDAPVEPEAANDQGDWHNILKGKFKGNSFYPDASQWNCEKIMETCAALSFNEMTSEIFVNKPPPWHSTTHAYPAPWTDLDTVHAVSWMQGGVGFAAAWDKTTVEAGALAAASKNKFHPVQDYLRGLEWDQKLRLDSWLISYCRAEDNDYTRMVGKKWLLSAVARALEPGCKVDCMLVLVGETGVGKSQTFEILGGKWYSSDLGDVTRKDAAERIRNMWIVEDPEMSAFRRVDDTEAKAFLTRRGDQYRPAYARHALLVLRSCVFGSSVNEAKFLSDPTGGRRYWPVAVGYVNLDSLMQDRDQLWAEAVAAYKQGEKWWLSNREEERLAAAEQARRYNSDPWETPVKQATEGLTVVEDPSALLAAVGMSIDKRNKAAMHRISVILQTLGFQPTRNGRWQK